MYQQLILYDMYTSLEQVQNNFTRVYNNDYTYLQLPKKIFLGIQKSP